MIGIYIFFIISRINQTKRNNCDTKAGYFTNSHAHFFFSFLLVYITQIIIIIIIIIFSFWNDCEFIVFFFNYY